MPAQPSAELTAVNIASERRQTRALALTVYGLDSLNAMTDDFLRVASLQGQEGISQPYQLNIELRANDVEQLSDEQVDQLASFNTLDVIGLWATVRISRAWNENRFEHKPVDAAPDWENDTPSRYFQGVVTSMSMAAPGVYQLGLGSPLHNLTLRNRYFIYQDCDIRQLFTRLLNNETASGKLLLDFRFDDSLTISRTQDWLQAGESDFAFLQRVAGHAALHFYFIHQQDNLLLVFSNRPTSLQEVDIPNSAFSPLKLRYSYSSTEKLGAQQDDLLCDLNYQVKQMPGSVGAVLTREQAEWEQNDVAGFTSYDATEDVNDPPQYLLHHRYAYGTNLQEAQGQLKKVCQGIATDQATLSGSATSALLSPGYTFELTQPQAGEVKVARLMRQSFSGRTFVVTNISHKVSDTEAYKGSLQATEVTAQTDSNQGTFLTPFAVENTQQGSVLAKVLQTAVPRGWRYREKNNFQMEQAQNKFDGETEKEKGCLVQLATAQSADEMFWVRLGQGTQTAPEVGAMVMISRANNDSELPELSVIASHGSKTIQPPDRRNQSWTANTSWGSNYSTTYGDGISIRYGYSSAVNFAQAKTMVEAAYDQADMLGHSYSNSSFSRGGGFSVSASDQDADGVISASVSLGSSFNESHAKLSYGYSDTGTSQSYSKVGKTVSRSVIGDYDGNADLDSPSFINGKVPDQSIIDIADSLNVGDTYNENHTKGRSISLSGNGAPPPGFSGTSAISYSDSITLGDTYRKSFDLGDSTAISTHIGNSDSSSLNIGNSNSLSTQIGNVFGVNTFLGSRTDVSTTLAETNNIDTFIGLKNILSTKVAETRSVSTSIGPTSTVDTNVGVTDSISTHISATNALSTNISASNNLSTNIGVSNSFATNISASNSIATNIGVSNSVTTNVSDDNRSSTTLGISNNSDTYLGLKNSNSTFIGATNDLSMKLAASMSNSVVLGASISNSAFVGLSMETKVFAGINIHGSISAGLDIDLNPAPTKINPVRPSVEITIDAGPNITMVVMEIKM